MGIYLLFYFFFFFLNRGPLFTFFFNLMLDIKVHRLQAYLSQCVCVCVSVCLCVCVCVSVCVYVPRHMEFLGQGSDPSHNFYLCCGCGHTGSLTHCVGVELTEHCTEAGSPGPGFEGGVGLWR